MDVIVDKEWIPDEGIGDFGGIGMAFIKDSRVRWISSGTPKVGSVVAVVPVGVSPHSLGFTRIDAGTAIRDEESYIVKGHVIRNGKPETKTTLYWPRTSLLEPVDSLSEAEIAWCHANPHVVRAMMQGKIAPTT